MAAIARACGLEGLEPWGSHTYKEQQVEEEEKVLGDFDAACPHPAGPGAHWGERERETDEGDRLGTGGGHSGAESQGHVPGHLSPVTSSS